MYVVVIRDTTGSVVSNPETQRVQVYSGFFFSLKTEATGDPDWARTTVSGNATLLQIAGTRTTLCLLGVDVFGNTLDRLPSLDTEMTIIQTTEQFESSFSSVTLSAPGEAPCLIVIIEISGTFSLKVNRVVGVAQTPLQGSPYTITRTQRRDAA